MKIVITGHTSGLGKEIFEYFSKNHEVIGCSRSNDYKLPDKINDVLLLAKTADLFINNAHVGLVQSIFMRLLYEHCSIITSGSIGANYSGKGNAYYDQKKNIENTFYECRLKTSKPMLLLKMGYLENFPHKYPIKYSTIVQAIDFWLNNPRVSMIEFENDPAIYK